MFYCCVEWFINSVNINVCQLLVTLRALRLSVIFVILHASYDYIHFYTVVKNGPLLHFQITSTNISQGILELSGYWTYVIEL